jgi:hypothetical protein
MPGRCRRGSGAMGPPKGGLSRWTPTAGRLLPSANMSSIVFPTRASLLISHRLTRSLPSRLWSGPRGEGLIVRSVRQPRLTWEVIARVETSHRFRPVWGICRQERRSDRDKPAPRPAAPARCQGAASRRMSPSSGSIATSTRSVRIPWPWRAHAFRSPGRRHSVLGHRAACAVEQEPLAIAVAASPAGRNASATSGPCLYPSHGEWSAVSWQ